MNWFKKKDKKKPDDFNDLLTYCDITNRQDNTELNFIVGDFVKSKLAIENCKSIIGYVIEITPTKKIKKLGSCHDITLAVVNNSAYVELKETDSRLYTKLLDIKEVPQILEGFANDSCLSQLPAVRSFVRPRKHLMKHMYTTRSSEYTGNNEIGYEVPYVVTHVGKHNRVTVVARLDNESNSLNEFDVKLYEICAY